MLQFGEVFDSWSGDVNISCTNEYVTINPSTANVLQGSVEIGIVFESITEEVQQVQVKLSYEGIVVEIDDVILVGSWHLLMSRRQMGLIKVMY
jgi:hypothetical protein